MAERDGVAVSYAQAAFMLSATEAAHFPIDQGGEIAFVGRSNAGKSSAINALTYRRALARTSKTPGRTQQINFFRLDEQLRLVDLPGYGFAKVPARIRRHWERLIESYLQYRSSLLGLVILVDVRRSLSDLDRQLLDWCQEAAIPAHVLLTKADKLSRNAAHAVLHQVQAAISEDAVTGAALPIGTVQLFSATKKQGVDELRARLDQWFGSGIREKKSPS